MSFYIFPPLFAFALCNVLALVVLLRDHRSLVYRIFALFLIFGGLWDFAIFGMRASPDLGHALAWEKAVLIAISVTAISLYRFSLAYRNIRLSKVSHLATYLFPVLVAIFTPIGLVVSGMQLKPYGYAPVPGPLFFPVALGFYLFAILALNNLVKSYKASTSYDERNWVSYIIIGLCCSLIGGIADVLPLSGLPSYPGAIIGNTIFAILASVAVLRYHLLDIHIVIRKALAYFLMSTMVAIPYVSVIFLFREIFEGVIPIWAYFIFLLLLALVLQPLWQRVQRFVDRWFYRERYDFLRELEYFSQEAHDISNPKQLGSSLVKLIGRALQTSSVHLLLLSEAGDSTVISSIGKTAAQLTLKSHNPLLRWLRSNKGLLYYRDLDIIPQLQSLTVKEKKELENIGVELFIPLKTREDKLVGLVLLGKKLSQQPYSGEDKRLVLTIADRMAIELENARLYELERTMRAELQKQSELKTEFLHSVAHELKTPLTAIIASSEILDSGMPANNLRERLVANITRSAQVMDRRVSELLDFARVQAGELELKIEPVELGQTINEVASQLSILFQNKNQSLKLKMSDTKLRVKADREKLEQILVNLLSNANKFSPTGSTITLRVRAVDSKVIVEVEDSASAITEREKRRLFEPYYRGDDKGKRARVPGLGIGLSITKKLVELQNGEIRVESKPGRGNTFSFFLPAYSGE